MANNSQIKTERGKVPLARMNNNEVGQFDYPPPVFYETDGCGWTTLAKSIVSNNTGLKKYVVDITDRFVRFAQNYKDNEKNFDQYVCETTYSYSCIQNCSFLLRNLQNQDLKSKKVENMKMSQNETVSLSVEMQLSKNVKL